MVPYSAVANSSAKAYCFEHQQEQPFIKGRGAPMAAIPKDIVSKLTHSIWFTELTDMPGWRVRTTHMLRILFAVVRDITAGQLTLRAMSLVYTTLLSLVPLLAVSFSVLKAFGVHNQIEPMLLNLLSPLGAQGQEITTNIIGFVENMKVGILGTLGVALLFYTVVALMQKIESAFNHTWRVSHTRPLSQRFSDYLSVLMIGPVLVISALGLTSTMLNTEVVQWLAGFEPFGTLIKLLTKLIPYLLIICAFIFIYIFIPNTKVKLKSACIGALVAGVLWQTAGWGFATFVASSSKTMAIYSAFATLIFFLIWLYVGWLILLVGASIAFYVQNPDYVTSPRRELRLSNNMKERLALLVITKIADNFYHHRDACSAKQLALATNVPSDIVMNILLALEKQNLIKQTNDKVPVYLPAQPLDEISVKQVLDAIRQADEDEHLNSGQLSHNPEVDELFRQLDDSLQQTFSQRIIKELVTRQVKEE